MDFRDVIYSLLGQNEQACNAYFSAYQNRLMKSIKIITHKIGIKDFQDIVRENERKVILPWFWNNLDSYYIERKDESSWLGNHWLHESGFFYMQEIAASLPAPVLSWCFGNKPSDLYLLDMCAAPWGKSIQLADNLLSRNIRGIVVTNEVNATRMSALDHNIKRTGCFNTCTTSYSGELFWKLFPEFFDGVLVDAPCSGEGTGFKSDAGTKRRRQENALKISHIQKSLLESAIKACKPWGYIVYATCTINPRENEMVVQHALSSFSDSVSLENVEIEGKSKGIQKRSWWEILSAENTDKVARFWPHIQGTGGFFIAKFHKKNIPSNANKIPTIQSLPKSKKRDHLPSSQLTINEDLQTTMARLLRDDFGIIIDASKHFFVATESQIHLTSPEYKKTHTALYTKKIGIPIYKKDKATLIPLHGLWQILGHLATKNTVTLWEQEAQKYADGFDGETDFLPTTNNNFVIIKHKKYWISVGKIINGTIKNKFLK